MRNLHVDRGIFKERILLTKRNLRNFSFCKTFITANNQKLGSRFHLFTANYHIDAVIKLISSLVCAFSLVF